MFLLMEKSGHLTIKDAHPEVIEIVAEGYLTEDLASYLTELEVSVNKKPSVCLLFNTEKISGFSSHTSGPIALAISTVRLATSANMKGFQSRDEAMKWLLATS